jgi:hypothetical protein
MVRHVVKSPIANLSPKMSCGSADLPFCPFLDWDGWFDRLAHITTSRDPNFVIRTHNLLLTLLFDLGSRLFARSGFKRCTYPLAKQRRGNGHGDGFLFTEELLKDENTKDIAFRIKVLPSLGLLTEHKLMTILLMCVLCLFFSYESSSSKYSVQSRHSIHSIK